MTSLIVLSLLLATTHGFSFSASTTAFATSLKASGSTTQANKRVAWLAARGITPSSDTTTEELSKRRIRRVSVSSDLPSFTLTAGSSSAKIYPFGGLVAEYAVGDVKHVVCRPDAKFDGSKVSVHLEK